MQTHCPELGLACFAPDVRLPAAHGRHGHVWVPQPPACWEAQAPWGTQTSVVVALVAGVVVEAALQAAESMATPQMRSPSCWSAPAATAAASVVEQHCFQRPPPPPCLCLQRQRHPHVSDFYRAAATDSGAARPRHSLL